MVVVVVVVVVVMPFLTSTDVRATSSFLFLVVRLLLVVMPFVTSSDDLAPSSFLFLVVRPGATRTVRAPSRDALCSYSRVLAVKTRCRDCHCYADMPARCHTSTLSRCHANTSSRRAAKTWRLKTVVSNTTDALQVS